MPLIGPRPSSPVLRLLTLLLPSPCLGCDRPIDGWRPRLGLCVPCRGRLHPGRGLCPGCGAPIAAPDLPPGFRCGSCRLDPPVFDRLHAPYLYLPPLDRVVRHLKFGALPYLGRHAAREIAASCPPELRRADVVTAVPLHWRRRLYRGYNQAEEIARPLAALLDRPHAACLRRARATSPQASLARLARRSNPLGAFRPLRRTELADLRIVLVDDVVTTGATANAAASALVRAGAASVTVATLARTPPPGWVLPATGRILERQLTSGPKRRIDRRESGI